MKNKNKIYVGLGSLAAITSPIAAVISCSDSSTPTKTNKIETNKIETNKTETKDKNTKDKDTNKVTKEQVVRELAKNLSEKLLTKGLMGLSKDEFNEMANKLENNKIVQSVIDASVHSMGDKWKDFKISKFIKDVGKDNIYNLLNNIKTNGIANINDENIDTLMLLVESIPGAKKIIGIEDKAKFSQLFGALKTIFSSNLKNYLTMNKNDIVEKLLPSQSNDGVDLISIIKKALFQGFNNTTNSKDPKIIVEEMSNFVFDELIKSNLITEDLVPEEAKKSNISFDDVKEVVRKIINSLISNLVTTASHKYKDTDFDTEIANWQSDLTEYKKKMDDDKKIVDDEDLLNKIKSENAKYQQLLLDIKESKENNPYDDLLKDVGINEEMIEEIDNSSFQNQLGMMDTIKNGITAHGTWWTERSDIDVIISISFWHKYNADIKRETGFTTADEWLEKIGKLHYDEDYSINTSKPGDGESNDSLYVQKYIEEILPSKYAEFKNNVKKVYDAYIANPTMFDTKGVNQTDIDNAEALKEKIDDMQEKIDDFKNSQRIYKNQVNKIEAYKKLKARVELEKSIGFNQTDLIANEFFKGKGLLELSEKDMKNMFISISGLFVDFSNTINEAIDDALNNTTFHISDNIFANGFANAIAKMIFKTKLKEMEFIISIKNNPYTSIFDGINPGELGRVFSTILNKNISTFKLDDIKLLFKFIKNVKPEFSLDFTDEQLSFILKFITSGFDMTKPTHEQERKVISELIKKATGYEVSEEMLELFIK